jgi:hypothetical protein
MLPRRACAASREASASRRKTACRSMAIISAKWAFIVVLLRAASRPDESLADRLAPAIVRTPYPGPKSVLISRVATL